VLVPLPDVQGGPASAVVWMNDGRRSLDLLAMDEAAFGAEATLRSCGVLGPLTLASPRRLWPVVTQSADRLTAQRTAIVAEAAHVLPPIGAQGLNTSLHDVAALVDLAAADPEGLGAPAMLAAYETARARDIRTRATAIDLFNRVCRSGEAPVQALRLAGLKAVHDIAPLRRAVMRAGLGSLRLGPRPAPLRAAPRSRPRP
jgi:2-octaprenyl-6-methoxyphenol hydroxylase